MILLTSLGESCAHIYFSQVFLKTWISDIQRQATSKPINAVKTEQSKHVQTKWHHCCGIHNTTTYITIIKQLVTDVLNVVDYNFQEITEDDNTISRNLASGLYSPITDSNSWIVKQALVRNIVQLKTGNSFAFYKGLKKEPENGNRILWQGPQGSFLNHQCFKRWNKRLEPTDCQHLWM